MAAPAKEQVQAAVARPAVERPAVARPAVARPAGARLAGLAEEQVQLAAAIDESKLETAHTPDTDYGASDCDE
jgi:hypothetical protein